MVTRSSSHFSLFDVEVNIKSLFPGGKSCFWWMYFREPGWQRGWEAAHGEHPGVRGGDQLTERGGGSGQVRTVTSALWPKSSSLSPALLKCCPKSCFCPKPGVGMGVLSNYWCNCASLHIHIFRLVVFSLTINVSVTTSKSRTFGNVLCFISVPYGPLSAVWTPLRTEQLKGKKGQQGIHSLSPVCFDSHSQPYFQRI